MQFLNVSRDPLLIVYPPVNEALFVKMQNQERSPACQLYHYQRVVGEKESEELREVRSWHQHKKKHEAAAAKAQIALR